MLDEVVIISDVVFYTVHIPNVKKKLDDEKRKGLFYPRNTVWLSFRVYTRVLFIILIKQDLSPSLHMNLFVGLIYVV